MYDMFTVMHIKIENGIHWVTSIVSQFENTYNATSFPYKKIINDTEYYYITKTENVFTT